MLVGKSPWGGRRVLVTGHTGFKGGWLALWLHQLGAKVTGFALAPPTDPSFFAQVKLDELVEHNEGDVRDAAAVESVIAACEPEVIFHLAAQPLVRHSYMEPVETYATNVMGTAHVLDACRRVDGVKAVVCVTTDKCYENREWIWPYRESDPLGGHDPYSSSKGAAELVVAAYRRSFFERTGPAIASVRAGNVIGGGDWAKDRLIPDIIRAMISGDAPVIRSPDSIRPWQHVLDALAGYLLVADRLLRDDREAATAFNFGPSDDDTRPVAWVVERMLQQWGAVGWKRPQGLQPHEAVLLKLDSSKARNQLGWHPALPLTDALAMVVDWHRHVLNGGDARQISIAQLEEFADVSSGVPSVQARAA